MSKKLVIINGVTGAIGSACLALFGSDKNTVVYGISRKAQDFRQFCVEGKLPARTLICSIYGDQPGDTYPPRQAHYFGEAIDAGLFSEIFYVHALGVYPFEIDNQGNRTVHHDNDMDGFDDRCHRLTALTFGSFYSGIAYELQKPVHSMLFGGLADKHEPMVHASWAKMINSYKETLKDELKRSVLCKVSLLNISSVLCPNELISRPFVFTATDSDPCYWLQPVQVADRVKKIFDAAPKKKFKEYFFFKKKPGFNEKEYYSDEKFTPRKVAELYNAT